MSMETSDEIQRCEVPTIEVEDVLFVQPVGFVWFAKPRYRVPARTREVEPDE